MLPLAYLFSPWKNINTQDCFCLASFFVFSRRARDVFCTLGCFFPPNLQRTGKCFARLLILWSPPTAPRFVCECVDLRVSAPLNNYFLFCFPSVPWREVWTLHEYIPLAAIFWRRGVFSFPHFLGITVARSRTRSKRGFHVASIGVYSGMLWYQKL